MSKVDFAIVDASTGAVKLIDFRAFRRPMIADLCRH